MKQALITPETPDWTARSRRAVEAGGQKVLEAHLYRSRRAVEAGGQEVLEADLDIAAHGRVARPEGVRQVLQLDAGEDEGVDGDLARLPQVVLLHHVVGEAGGETVAHLGERLLQLLGVNAGRLVGVVLGEDADPRVDVVEESAELIEIHCVTAVLVKHADHHPAAGDVELLPVSGGERLLQLLCRDAPRVVLVHGAEPGGCLRVQSARLLWGTRMGHLNIKYYDSCQLWLLCCKSKY